MIWEATMAAPAPALVEAWVGTMVVVVVVGNGGQPYTALQRLGLEHTNPTKPFTFHYFYILSPIKQEATMHPFTTFIIFSPPFSETCVFFSVSARPC